VRDDNHRPVLDAAVNIDVSTLPPQLRHRSLNSNSSGTAEFTRLPAATVSVGATRVGYVPADPVSVGLAVDQRRTVDITLARCGVLEITVKDEHGQLFAGAEVAIAPSNGDDHGDASRQAKTNSRGVVRFSGLRPGTTRHLRRWSRHRLGRHPAWRNDDVRVLHASLSRARPRPRGERSRATCRRRVPAATPLPLGPSAIRR
jgi:hypothetical protein